MSSGTNRELIPGTQVAGYQIERELGRGAMAVVYLAIQINLQRRVALKVLGDELAANDEFVVRFFNEARAAAALSHPHIVQAYDAGIAEGDIHYFAMEYVEGETLFERIERQGYLRPGPGLQLALHVADALNYGWQRQRLTHGDIKPENVMINGEGHSKLADFGLAKIDEHDFEGSEIMLTPLYAAPEAIRGEAAKGDCRADIYSFGATLYHMFAGTPPFPGTRAQEVMQRHLTEPLEPLRHRNPAMPGRISELVGMLLAKAADERPGTWDEVQNRLKDIVTHFNSPSVVVKPARPADRATALRRGRPAAAAAQGGKRLATWVPVFALVLTIGLAFLLFAQRQLGDNDRSSGGRAPVAESPPAERPEGPPGPDTMGSPVPAETTDSQDWELLLTRLENAVDNREALNLLTAYAESQEGDLPERFHTLVSRYAAAGAAADGLTGEPQPASTEPPGAGDGQGETGSEAVDDEAEPRPGTAITQTAPAAPPSHSLHDDLSVARTPGAADAVLELTLSEEERGRDAALYYLYRLSTMAYDFPAQMEGPVQAGRQWLLSYPGLSRYRELIGFAVGTVLPALEEAVPKLAVNSDAIAGTRLPGKAYAGCTVHDITVDELVLREKTRHGVMFRRVSWERQRDPVMTIVYLNRVAAMTEDSWKERRPYLALLLFTEYGEKLWEEAVSDLPLTPEASLWKTFRESLASAESEGEALRLWQDIQAAVTAGNAIRTYRLCKALRATRAQTATRYEARLDALEERTRPLVPGVAGGELVRRAASHLDGDPGRALSLLVLAKAHHGDVDYPEKTRLPDLFDKALRTVPLPEWLEQVAKRHPLAALLPFGTPAVPIPQYLPMRLYTVADSVAETLPGRKRRAVAAMKGACLLQMGDWSGAASACQEVPDVVMQQLPAELRCSLAFSRACVAHRFQHAPDDASLETLSRLASQTGSLPAKHAHLGRILALEYGLLTRHSGTGWTASAVPLTGISGGTAEARERLLLDRLAYLIERNDIEDAMDLLATALEEEKTGDGTWDLAPTARPLLQAALRALKARNGAVESGSLFPDGLSEWQLNVAVAILLKRDAWSEHAWLRTTEIVELRGESMGIIGGVAVYDAVLARVGDRLTAGSLSDALDAVEWARLQPAVCLVPYYARLCFLRGGLLQLASRGGAGDVHDTVIAATCASTAEKAVAASYRDDRARSRADDLSATNSELRFWHGWLDVARRTERGDQTALSQWVDEWSDRSVPRSRRLLLNGLVSWGRQQVASTAERAE